MNNQNESSTAEEKQWQSVKDLIGSEKMSLGKHWSFNLRNDPKRLPFVLSRYKFAAKMACQQGNIIELGCSDGIGVPLLATAADTYLGVDLDKPAIETAKQNWEDQKHKFIYDDFLGKTYGQFQAVISLDVCEHIHPDAQNKYFDTIAQNNTDTGYAVVGTPNITADQYASPMSKQGHINLFSGDRLKKALQRIYHNVFLFGINDEVVHTGYTPMCHYIIALACNKKSQPEVGQ